MSSFMYEILRSREFNEFNEFNFGAAFHSLGVIIINDIHFTFTVRKWVINFLKPLP